jgi:cytochrome c oxidase subunit 4
MAVHPRAEEHAHPGAMTYVRIAVVLAILTSIEVAVYYIEALHDFLVYILVVLSAIKFATVVGYYMHLKFDNRLLTWVFLGGLLTAMSVILSLLALFDRLW